MIVYMKEIKQNVEEMVDVYLENKKIEENKEEIDKNPILKALKNLNKKDRKMVQKYL